MHSQAEGLGPAVGGETQTQGNTERPQQVMETGEQHRPHIDRNWQSDREQQKQMRRQIRDTQREMQPETQIHRQE